MHDISDLVRRRFRKSAGELPFTYGAAVAFPDYRVSGTLPPRCGGSSRASSGRHHRKQALRGSGPCVDGSMRSGSAMMESEAVDDEGP